MYVREDNMILQELLSKFENSTFVKIELLTGAKTQSIYAGQIQNWSHVVDLEWLDNDFKNFDVTWCSIKDNKLCITIES